MTIIDHLPLGRSGHFRLELAKMRRSQARVSRSYDKDIRAALARKASRDDIQSIDTAASWEFSNAEEEIHKLQTRYYRALARDLFVDTKIEDTDWVKDLDTGGQTLTVAAIARLRQDIRKERLEQRQAWLVFVPFLSFLAASIAAVTGLITVFHRTAPPQPPPPVVLLQNATPSPPMH